MEVIDCVWELQNLACPTAEVSVTSLSDLDCGKLRDIERQFDYVVIKADSKCFDLYRELTALGYQFVETQFSIQKNIRKFDVSADRLTQKYLPDFRCEPIVSEEELQTLLDRMTPNMYSTDRVCLDSSFGPQVGLRRYRNWTKTEFERGSSCLRMIYKDKTVGMAVMRESDVEVHCLLAGFFEEYQNMGLGILIPALPILYKNTDKWLYKTDISSNNLPVLQMYMHHDYNITKVRYVFVKHIR